VNGHDIKRMMGVRDTLTRIYADTRFPTNELRLLAVTAVWVVGIERPPGNRWQRIMQIMRLDGYRFWHLISEDAPRYQPPTRYGNARCEAPKGPRARTPGPCGKSGNQSFRVTDATTGAWRIASFCTGHRAYAEQVHRAERELHASGALPEPMPNTGGLLPCYINTDWPDLYTRARSSWKPPSVGICADDWPVTALVAQAAPPKLKLITSAEGESAAVGGPPPPGGHDTPTLRVVKNGDAP
jgi:hypothetical protein